jgi:hypothetical protein
MIDSTSKSYKFIRKYNKSPEENSSNYSDTYDSEKVIKFIKNNSDFCDEIIKQTFIDTGIKSFNK